MKNSFDRFIQSKLRFWKKPEPDSPTLPSKESFRPPSPQYTTYPTSILKDFIAAVTRKPNPVVLDIGPVIGSNIEFFLNLGVKIYMEDLLPAYLNPMYTRLIDDKLTLDEQKFFSENLQYEDAYFDGLICWDMMNYVDPRFAKSFAAAITAKMRPDSCILGLFHTQKDKGPSALYKYRVCSETMLEYIPIGLDLEVKRVYQTRDVTQLFSAFESQKFYLLKHNMIEVLLKKRPQAPTG
jgi:2-polyprenyl-3-methyl-5-hydroxy-6-metoxy-1,4-benzoquinol methylase